MTPASTAPMGDDDFEALDAILDDLRARGQAAPEWEFCEGFIAALICSRRAVPPEEYFPVLFGSEEALEDEPAPNFADEAQASRFLALWTRRWSEVAAALDAQIESLDDEGAYAPEIVDLRGMVAMLPPEEREPLEGEPIPAFAQLWADGFMAAVECWPEDWAPPRDREQAQWVEECLDAIEALTEDDTDPPTLSPLGDDAPPSVSESRLEAYGEAIWAVYDLRALWRSLGPRIDPIRRSHEPGRNDPCPCGSGKKYKKCHGAV